MQFRKVGSLDVSVIGLGCSNFGRALDEQQSIDLVHAALDLGITFLDTANVYGRGMSEQFLGAALEGHRDKAIIATKFGKVGPPNPDGSQVMDATRTGVRQALEESFRRLRTDYIELYLLHAPDPKTPILETLEVLNQLIDEGKIGEIGCSGVDVAFLREAAAAAKENGLRSFVNVQNRYNLLEGERESESGVVRECTAEGLAFVPYSPLASGMLSGKYRRGAAPSSESRLGSRPVGEYTTEYLLTDQFFDTTERLSSYAEAHGHTVLELAFAGLLADPTLASIIAGATSAAQLAANVAGADWVLSDEEFDEVKKLAELAD